MTALPFLSPFPKTAGPIDPGAAELKPRPADRRTAPDAAPSRKDRTTTPDDAEETFETTLAEESRLSNAAEGTEGPPAASKAKKAATKEETTEGEETSRKSSSVASAIPAATGVVEGTPIVAVATLAETATLAAEPTPEGNATSDVEGLAETTPPLIAVASTTPGSAFRSAPIASDRGAGGFRDIGRADPAATTVDDGAPKAVDAAAHADVATTSERTTPRASNPEARATERATSDAAPTHADLTEARTAAPTDGGDEGAAAPAAFEANAEPAAAQPPEVNDAALRSFEPKVRPETRGAEASTARASSTRAEAAAEDATPNAETTGAVEAPADDAVATPRATPLAESATAARRSESVARRGAADAADAPSRSYTNATTSNGARDLGAATDLDGAAFALEADGAPELRTAESRVGAADARGLDVRGPHDARALEGGVESTAREATTARAETAPRPSAADVARSLERLRGAFEGGPRDVVLRLDPPELGRMHVRLEARGDGVTARVVFESPSAAAAFRDERTALERFFAEHGVSLLRLDVSAEDRGARRGRSDAFEDDATVVPLDKPRRADATPTLSRAATLGARGGLDLLV